MSGNYVINIGRQLGSGGKEIGEKLAARLGINFYDKELINLASEESGLCKEFFEKADEKASQGIIGGLFGMRFPFISEGAMPCNNCLSNDADSSSLGIEETVRFIEEFVVKKLQLV